MKTILSLIFSLFLFSIFLISCGDKDCQKKIRIVNNSDHSIYFQANFLYPDTIPKYAGMAIVPNTYKVESHSYKDDYNRNCLNDLLQYEYPILMYFVFDAETVENTPWDTICAKYLILKRYDLNYYDLDSMNWTITYP